MSDAIAARLMIEPTGINGFTLTVYSLQNAKDAWFKWYGSELAAYMEADDLGFTTNLQSPGGKAMHVSRKLKEKVSVDEDQLIGHGFDRVVC
jgi:hypothetical protein